ncbi:MAG: hypothetical protein KF845_08975 [Cyclobacteriaceae bacterium]|nr:hypothetical protein [Cyclobacteriaceae bacterium]
MIKKVAALLIILISALVISYIVYKRYAPEIIANELLKETEPAFLPKKVTEKIKEVKVQTNHLSVGIIKDIHKSNITLDQILKSLDEVTEDKADLLLYEINNLGQLKSSDQVFDLIKKHFPADYDIESLREPFRDKADVQKLQTLIQKANEYRNNNLINFESVKAIIKRILIEKEKEFNKHIETN